MFDGLCRIMMGLAMPRPGDRRRAEMRLSVEATECSVSGQEKPAGLRLQTRLTVGSSLACSLGRDHPSRSVPSIPSIHSNLHLLRRSYQSAIFSSCSASNEYDGRRAAVRSICFSIFEGLKPVILWARPPWPFAVTFLGWFLFLDTIVTLQVSTNRRLEHTHDLR